MGELVKFRIGPEEEEVKPQQGSVQPAEHLAWAMEAALKRLNANQNDIVLILKDYIKAIQSNPKTTVLINEGILKSLQSIEANSHLQSKHFAEAFIFGVPVPEKGYISYDVQSQNRISNSK